MGEPLVVKEQPAPGLAVLTLNRPDKRNALNIPLLETLCDELENAIRDSRVLVLCGAGPAFCAGLDLAEARDEAKAHRSAELMRRALQHLMTAPITTIAAAQGPAVAGGAGLVLACDLLVAAGTFRTGFPEVRRGLVAGLVMTFVRRKLDEALARELLLLGDLIDAERAQAAGLVNRVVPEDRLREEALAMAQTALKAAPGAVARTKRLYDEFWHLPVYEHLDRAEELHVKMRTSEEAREGLLAFQEKRPPRWDPASQNS